MESKKKFMAANCRSMDYHVSKLLEIKTSTKKCSSSCQETAQLSRLTSITDKIEKQ